MLQTHWYMILSENIMRIGTTVSKIISNWILQYLQDILSACHVRSSVALDSVSRF